MKDLRILIVEDSGRDFDLIVRQLRRAGYEVHSERIETAEEMASALQRGPWDAIVSDNALPSFDAAGALRVLEASGRDIPLIVASGMIGEERAVELMKGGA
ncbi:MAG TPA: response regulator, partial [Bryobacteraceae bacterium]|nr:response regulator [Bryobacteraceae bacterium]